MATVFVSYRRGDSESEARALVESLKRRLGQESVFMDVDNIALGRDFRRVLNERLARCELVLALIGPKWLDSTDASGRRRLDDPRDYVRQELAAALKRDIPVTPVLLKGASIPLEDQLPDEVKDLAFRHSFELSHNKWDADVDELLRRLRLTRSSRLQWISVGAVALAIVAVAIYFSLRDSDRSSSGVPIAERPVVSKSEPPKMASSDSGVTPPKSDTDAANSLNTGQASTSQVGRSGVPDKPTASRLSTPNITSAPRPRSQLGPDDDSQGEDHERWSLGRARACEHTASYRLPLVTQVDCECACDIAV